LSWSRCQFQLLAGLMVNIFDYHQLSFGVLVVFCIVVLI
jgi:hypothetical protein